MKALILFTLIAAAVCYKNKAYKPFEGPIDIAAKIASQPSATYSYYSKRDASQPTASAIPIAVAHAPYSKRDAVAHPAGVAAARPATAVHPEAATHHAASIKPAVAAEPQSPAITGTDAVIPVYGSDGNIIAYRRAPNTHSKREPAAHPGPVAQRAGVAQRAEAATHHAASIKPAVAAEPQSPAITGTDEVVPIYGSDGNIFAYGRAPNTNIKRDAAAHPAAAVHPAAAAHPPKPKAPSITGTDDVVPIYGSDGNIFAYGRAPNPYSKRDASLVQPSSPAYYGYPNSMKRRAGVKKAGKKNLVHGYGY